MRFLIALVGCLVLVLGGSCGGSSTAVVLLGPFLVDFETRPDDGFVALTPPVFLGNGATLTSVTNGTPYDFTTADNWGLGGCPAIATSGNLMMGAAATGSVPAVTEITFNPPVARVTLALADLAGTLVSLEARDAGSNLIDADDVLVGFCPVLLLPLTVDGGDSNTIASIRIVGGFPAWDDLQTWRWSQ
jgi:hypothetical protein